jgi:2-dehydro-3-deoxyphosphogalactonate aldolase
MRSADRHPAWDYPEAAIPVGAVLVEAGFEIIEVPLNSPDPFASIERLVRTFGETALIGAGTVLRPEQVDSVSDAGGRLIVMQARQSFDAPRHAI